MRRVFLWLFLGRLLFGGLASSVSLRYFLLNLCKALGKDLIIVANRWRNFTISGALKCCACCAVM